MNPFEQPAAAPRMASKKETVERGNKSADVAMKKKEIMASIDDYVTVLESKESISEDIKRIDDSLNHDWVDKMMSKYLNGDESDLVGYLYEYFRKMLRLDDGSFEKQTPEDQEDKINGFIKKDIARRIKEYKTSYHSNLSQREIDFFNKNRENYVALKDQEIQKENELKINFQELIRAGAKKEVLSILNYVRQQKNVHQSDFNQRLAVLIDSVFNIPRYVKDDESEMERVMNMEMWIYEATPAEWLLDLVRKLNLSPRDTFLDIGSGFGRLAMTVGAVSDAKVRGVEYNQAYCKYAAEQSEKLNLKNVEFVNDDIQSEKVNFSDVTVFYIFNSVTGTILDNTIKKIHEVAKKKKIRVCVLENQHRYFKEKWLKQTGIVDGEVYIFESDPAEIEK